MTSIILASGAIFISFCTGLLMYKRLDPPWLRLFVFFLLFSLLIQIGGFLYSHFLRKSNHFIFNIDIIVEFLFYLYLFYRAIVRRGLKKTVLLLAGSFIVFAFGNLFFGQTFRQFNSNTYTFGTILIIIACLLYFAEIFTANYVMNFFRLPFFWISTGLLFFYAGTFTYLMMFGYIREHKLDEDGKIFAIMMVVLNIILNLLFIIGFLCKLPWRKKSL